ncbi:MAG: peptide chain release factor 1 [Sphaerochaetaceae bacterium]|nr:peptide chain release factor 1 [Spirochaetales bacterium]MDY3769123.1 peptide chain release factor 1 [Sphaerochaetaceae bacterium]MDY5968224.1 peptide chain release factor 1 [Sphaerochaetaceae bacterium]
MIEFLEENVKLLQQVDDELMHLDISKEQGRYKELSIKRASLAELVENLTALKNDMDSLEANFELLKGADSEMSALIKEDIETLKNRIEKTELKCKTLLVPPDPLDGKNIIMEIRAGTGGEEASLFALDLYRMYLSFAERKGFKSEVISLSESGLGGIKEIVFSVSGKSVYGTLRYESGTHRVQRVPETESSGRIHTSAVTVAVLPEMEETDIVIRPEDLKIDVMRAGGPGGQCVNTTDSAVRITHLPTGLVVIQQDEKSQIKNKAKALKVLRSRLYEMEEEKKNRERSENRKSQVGSGDRSERIRTYNFPQNRVTDHRVNVTLYHLDTFMQGEMDDIIDALKIDDAERQLKNS